MAAKKPGVKAKKPEPPKKVKIDPQAGVHDLHLRHEVELLVNHPDGGVVEITLHPRKRGHIPLRYFDALRKVGSADNAENMEGMMECFKLCLSSEEYEMLLDNCTIEDLETLVPVMFGADPS